MKEKVTGKCFLKVKAIRLWHGFSGKVMGACLLRSCLNKNRRKILLWGDLRDSLWTQVISETGLLAWQRLLLCIGLGETEADVSTRKETLISFCIPSSVFRRVMGMQDAGFFQLTHGCDTAEQAGVCAHNLFL